MTTPVRQPREHGSGSVLAVAVVGAIAAVTLLLLPILGLLTIGQTVRAAADASALAGADTAAGLVPGVPCELAQRAADLNSARLVACTVDGLVVTVTVTRNAGGFVLSTRARAGPPAEPD
ncbi:Rv3654c family TadE-like protein [Cryobacterium arcticum]|uniref:Helicase n=1 Tax=Cryobacterium arcticum TaxID=670052 RepID=A0A1B1BG74_9MICO|nr:Rv3654c family TadE-like protein [Cryobacterium arcticum]ANP71486.1 hypothetical protein PA27867_0517 [Cryobacterium arcticum]